MGNTVSHCVEAKKVEEVAPREEPKETPEKEEAEKPSEEPEAGDQEQEKEEGEDSAEGGDKEEEEKPAEEDGGEGGEEAEPEEEPKEEEEDKKQITVDDIKTAPMDWRFPTTNQARHCFTRYNEYHKCVAEKGEDSEKCEKYAKYYRSLCPGDWVDKWNEQRENGVFAGRY